MIHELSQIKKKKFVNLKKKKMKKKVNENLKYGLRWFPLNPERKMFFRVLRKKKKK